MARKSLTHEAVDGVAWQTIAIGANVVLRALILILLARTLDAAAFGIIAAAMVVMNISEKLSQIGVGRVLVQELELKADDIRNAFAISLWTGILATLVIGLAAPLFVALFRIDGVDDFIRYLSITLLLNNLAAVPAGLLQRARRFKAAGLVELGSYVFGYGVIALPMAAMGFGAWSLAIAQGAQVASRALALFVLATPKVRLWPEWARCGHLLSSGTGFSAGQVGNFVATQVDYLVVGRFLGAEALGFYNRAYQFLMLPTQLFGAAVSAVLFPTVASIQDQPERVARAFLRALGVIAMFTIAASGVLIILAPELVRFVLGPRWAPMTIAFQILVSTLLCRTSYKICDAVTLAMGSMNQRALRQWIYAGAVAAGAFAGTRWGIIGVSVGVGAAVVLNFLLMLQLAMKVTSLELAPVVQVHLKQLFAGTVLAVPTWLFAYYARSWGMADFAILLLGGTVAALTALLLWFCWRGLYGEPGEWLAQVVHSRLLSSRRRGGELGGVTAQD